MAHERFKKPVIERAEVIKDFSFEGVIRPDNPVRVIDLLVEKIVDSSPEVFIEKKDNDYGATGYHPKVFLKLYLYGYYYKIQSSRHLEQECERNMEVIWLLKGQKPRYWKINQYRTEHKSHIAFVTKEFRHFLFKEGFIHLEAVTVDGTKVKANQSRDVLTIKKVDKKLKSLDRKINEYLRMLDLNDEVENLEEKLMKKKEEKETLKEEVSSMEREIMSIIEKKRVSGR
ncbi:MAG TPA: transposase [Ignavibacteriales bacterium]|jgi:transposase|nr:transposase [Ignavibacteriales bacterium]